MGKARQRGVEKRKKGLTRTLETMIRMRLARAKEKRAKGRKNRSGDVMVGDG